MTSCGFSAAENGAPPAPENWIDTVAADAGVSILKYDDVPGASSARDVSPVIGNRNNGSANGMSDDPPDVTKSLFQSCFTLRVTNRLTAGAVVRGRPGRLSV